MSTIGYKVFPGGSDDKESACNARDPVQSLRREDPPEKEMATHPSILDRRISWTEEPGALQSTGLQRVGHDRVTYTFTSTGDKKNIKLNIKDCY